jgi:hypothetical protein
MFKRSSARLENRATISILLSLDLSATEEAPRSSLTSAAVARAEKREASRQHPAGSMTAG